METVVKCPLCSHQNFRFELSSCDYNTYVDQQEYSLFRCQNCQLVILKDRPYTTEIGRYYPAKYYSYNTKGDTIL
jgi:DNA-directed RNA polymerase subunit RPC12/RpoP